MLDFFNNINPILGALIATIFTYSITALGAALVFFFKNINKNIMDAMLGFAAGVMIAASFWSLLAPSIEMADNLNMIPWIIACSGFLSGGLLLFLGDKLYNIIDRKKEKQGKSKSNRIKRCLLLVFAITLHNIPEGLAVGVAFGSIPYHLDGATTLSHLCRAYINSSTALSGMPAITIPLIDFNEFFEKAVEERK